MGKGTDSRRHKDAGVTLIEMLVVLVLVAVGAGVVTLALPSGAPARTLAQESSLMIARLNIAAERSLISGTPYRMNWTANGYSFERWEEDRWKTAPAPPLSEAHAMDADLSLSSADGAQTGQIEISPDLLPYGSAPAGISLRAGTATQSVRFDGATAYLWDGA